MSKNIILPINYKELPSNSAGSLINDGSGNLSWGTNLPMNGADRAILVQDGAAWSWLGSSL